MYSIRNETGALFARGAHKLQYFCIGTGVVRVESKPKLNLPNTGGLVKTFVLIRPHPRNVVAVKRKKKKMFTHPTTK